MEQNASGALASTNEILSQQPLESAPRAPSKVVALASCNPLAHIHLVETKTRTAARYSLCWELLDIFLSWPWSPKSKDIFASSAHNRAPANEGNWPQAADNPRPLSQTSGRWRLSDYSGSVDRRRQCRRYRRLVLVVSERVFSYKNLEFGVIVACSFLFGN